MPDIKKGRIAGVNGNLLTVEFETAVTQNEVAYAILGDLRLKSEVQKTYSSCNYTLEQSLYRCLREMEEP